jgi:hypothetical protein
MLLARSNCNHATGQIIKPLVFHWDIGSKNKEGVTAPVGFWGYSHNEGKGDQSV